MKTNHIVDRFGYSCYLLLILDVSLILFIPIHPDSSRFILFLACSIRPDAADEDTPRVAGYRGITGSVTCDGCAASCTRR